MTGPLAFVFSPLAGDRIAASFDPLLKGLSDKAEAIDDSSTRFSAQGVMDEG